MDSAQQNLKIVITSQSDQAKQDISQFGQALKGIQLLAGAAILASITQRVVEIGAASIKSAVDFQSSMMMIQTQAGASHAEVTRMSDAVLKLATTVQTGPEALAQGLYHVESAGFRGAQALDILRVAAEGAKIGNANLEDVSNALISAVASGIGGFKDASQAMAVLNATVGAGNMRMQDLASAMSSGILPVAKTFGLSIQDVGAALATLTDNGVPAQEAATRLRMEFSLMAAPTKNAIGALGQLGMTQRELADDMRSGGLVKGMQDLHNHIKASGVDATTAGEILSKAFGGGRSSSGIMTLLDQLDRLKSKYKDINGETNNFGKAWEAEQTTAKAKMDQFRADLEVLGVKIGNAILPVLISILTWVNSHWSQIAATFASIGTAIMKAFQAVSPLITTVTGALSAFFSNVENRKAVLIATLAVLTVAFTVWAVGVVAATWPILATLAIVGTAVYAMTKIWDQNTGHIRDIVIGFVRIISGEFRLLVDFIVAIFTGFSDLFSGKWNKLWSDLRNSFKAIIGDIQNIFKGFQDFVMGIINSVIDGVTRAAGAAAGVSGKSVPHKALGGFASGMTLVGENGPELVNLPSGSYVHTNQQTQGVGGGGINVTINNPTVRSQNDIQQIVQQVQQVLGRQYELAKMGAIS